MKKFFIMFIAMIVNLFSVKKEVNSIVGMCLTNSKDSQIKKSLVGNTLMNAGMQFPSHVGGHRLSNANGDIDPTSTGFQYVIDTLTYIRDKVVNQTFYEISIADYVPVDVGEAAWLEAIVQNLVFTTGGSFYEGDIDTQSDTSRVAQVGAALAPISMPVKTWAKAAGWTIFEIMKAAAANKWDVVASKLTALKKNWDLGVQRTAFLGHPDGTITGLLNAAEVNINTSLITVPITEMSEAQFTTFVGGLLSTYFTNSNSTTLPDTLVMPADDYLGLVVPYSTSFPNISKLQYMLDAFSRMVPGNKFNILPLAYAQNANNPMGKDRYALYKNDPETLALSIPVDFTMLEADTNNKMNWQQGAYGQYSGVLVNKKREMYYLDETST